MKKYNKEIKGYFVRLKTTIDGMNLDELSETMNILAKAYKKKQRIYVCGNGGSAATASHMTNDFNKGICYNLTKKFNFNCLNDNVATLMAIANDDSYDLVFSKQLEGRMEPNDLLIAISGSGNSKNIVKAVEYAKSINAKVIGISGYSGGKLKELADYHMHVNINDMQIVEDVHMILNHMMMKIFSKEFVE